MIDRRGFLQGAGALGLIAPGRALAAADAAVAQAESADDLPPLRGSLSVYLGRGEGGLYGDIVAAIRKRNPDLDLAVRRAPSAALANTLVAENAAGGPRADSFWSIDASSLGEVAAHDMGQPVPKIVRRHIDPDFRYREWAAISGRMRTVPYNPERVSAKRIPKHIMDFADADFEIAWAPSYGAFQSFITAMRLLEGDDATRGWLRGVKKRAKSYAGELGVVIAVSRGEADLGFANHYYTLRLKKGQPDASVALALTENDAGSLVNSSGVVLLNDRALAANFVRYLLSREVQSYLAREAFEIPMAPGVAPPAGVPEDIDPPDLDLTRLGNLEPTLALMRETGVL